MDTLATFFWEYPYIFSYLLAINAICFAFFGFDKYFAIFSYSRVRERTLLLLALAGGSVGAWGSVFLFRHKTRKIAFLIILSCITLAQVALVLFWLYDSAPPNNLYEL